MPTEPSLTLVVGHCPNPLLTYLACMTLLVATLLPSAENVFNPYPANVENMVSSYQCQQMADGI